MALILALFVRDRRVWHVRSDLTPNPGKQRHVLVYRQNLVVFASQEAVSRYPSLGERITGDDIQ
jgi:hypothetical protein